MLFFLLSALRAIIEMLGLCLLAQGMLYVLAGNNRQKNPIYQFFALISRGPRQWVARCLPAATGPAALSAACLLALFGLWIGLAWLRKLL